MVAKRIMTSIARFCNRWAWSRKQAIWQKMRREDINRANRPYPGAPDMHFPL